MPKSTVVQDVVLPKLTGKLNSADHNRAMLLADDADYVQDLAFVVVERETQLLAALTQLAELRAASEWVSVEDRLPPEDWVLLRYASGACTVGGYVDGDYVSQMGSLKKMNARSPQFTPATITHWRPLPPQPSPASAVKGE